MGWEGGGEEVRLDEVRWWREERRGQSGRVGGQGGRWGAGGRRTSLRGGGDWTTGFCAAAKLAPTEVRFGISRGAARAGGLSELPPPPCSSAMRSLRLSGWASAAGGGGATGAPAFEFRLVAWSPPMGRAGPALAWFCASKCARLSAMLPCRTAEEHTGSGDETSQSCVTHPPSPCSLQQPSTSQGTSRLKDGAHLASCGILQSWRHRVHGPFHPTSDGLEFATRERELEKLGVGAVCSSRGRSSPYNGLHMLGAFKT